ncbi:MAG: hypothetical protein E6132_05995 [Actinomyces sp.]|nr:hypothetical protein [Actinomyces sp.]
MISLIVEELPSGKILATGIPIVSPSPKFELNKAWSLDVTVPAAALASGLALEFLREWGCACWVDNGTQIVAGGILLQAPTITSEGDLRLECGGFLSYPVGQAWDAPRYDGIHVPVHQAVRMIWEHLIERSSLPVTVTIPTTTVTVGKPEEHKEFTTSTGEDVSFDAGPWRLNQWQTHDLGKTLDDLRVEAVWEVRETHRLNQDTGRVDHTVEYSQGFGARRHDIVLQVGLNVHPMPELEGGLPYATHVFCVGAGEGERTVVSPTLSRESVGLRRCVAVSDKGADSAKKATQTARSELALRRGGTRVKTFIMRETPGIPLSLISVGDWVQISGVTEWGAFSQWGRITSCDRVLESDSAVIEVEKE